MHGLIKVDYEGGTRAASTPQPLYLADHALNLADRYRWWLFGLLAVTYMVGFTGRWRIEPDSALFLTLGRNLATGQGYTYNGQPHHLVYPGWPYLIAATFKVFGTQTLVPIHIVTMLLGLAALALTYRLFLLHSGRPTAVVVTLGLGISRLFYRYNFELRNDLPFLVGVMAFLAGYEAIHGKRPGETHRRRLSEARWFDWALLVLGLLFSVTMRPTMLALIFTVVCAVTWSMIRDRRQRGHAILLLLLMAAAVLFFLFDPRRHGAASVLGRYEDGLWYRMTNHARFVFSHAGGDNLIRLFEPVVAEAFFGIDLGTGVNTLGSAVALGLGLWLFRERFIWGVWMLVTVLMTLLVQVQDRYFLPVLPLLVYAWWQGIVWVNRRVSQRSPTWGGVLFALLLALGAVPNAAKVGETFIEQHRSDFLAHYRFGKYAAIPELSRLIQQHTGPDEWAVVQRRYGRILTYLTERKVAEAWELPRPLPPPESILLMGPFDEPAEWVLKNTGSQPEAPLGTVRDEAEKVTWTLHRLRRVE